MRPLPASLITCLAVGAVLFGGCGTTKIDHAKAENLIRKSVAGLGQTKVKSIKCPSNVKVKKGGTFTCRGTLENGAHGTVTVHMTDDKGKVVVYPSDYHAG